MKPLLLGASVIVLIAALSSCAAPKAEPVVPKQTIWHAPTKEVPYRWSEERMF